MQAFYLLHLEPRRIQPVSVSGLDTRWLKSFDTLYFATDNPWMRVSKSLHRPGVVRTTKRLESFLKEPGVLYRSSYYNEWMKPQGFKHNLGNTLLSEHGLVANITLFRSPDMPDFDAAEVRAFELLSKHMTRSLQMSRRLEQPGPSSAAALDAVPHAVALLDQRCHLLYANSLMEAVVRRRQGLAVRGGTLRAIDAVADSSLAGLVARAASAKRGAGSGLAPITLSLPGRGRLIVRAMPVHGGPAQLLPPHHRLHQRVGIQQVAALVEQRNHGAAAGIRVRCLQCAVAARAATALRLHRCRSAACAAPGRRPRPARSGRLDGYHLRHRTCLPEDRVRQDRSSYAGPTGGQAADRFVALARRSRFAALKKPPGATRCDGAVSAPTGRPPPAVRG
jgi:hypothetical protein